MKNKVSLLSRCCIFLSLLVSGFSASAATLESEFNEIRSAYNISLNNKHYSDEYLFKTNLETFSQKYKLFINHLSREFRSLGPSRFIEKYKNMEGSTITLIGAFINSKVLIGAGASVVEKFWFTLDDAFLYEQLTKEDLHSFIRIFANRFSFHNEALDLTKYITKPSEARLMIKFVDRWSSLSIDELKESIHDFGVRFVDFDTSNSLIFDRVVEVIHHANIDEGQGFWVWKYVKAGANSNFSRRFEFCNLALGSSLEVAP